jgi:hypothetical protein
MRSAKLDLPLPSLSACTCAQWLLGRDLVVRQLSAARVVLFGLAIHCWLRLSLIHRLLHLELLVRLLQLLASKLMPVKLTHTALA